MGEGKMNYRERLERAVEYASEKGTFSKVNMCKNAKNVCVFGLGTFFREAFYHYDMKERLEVNLLSDNNSEKWGQEFDGILCVSPQELTKYDDLVVIPLIGESALKKVENQLKSLNLTMIKAEDLFFEMISDMPQDLEWFSKNEILDVYDILNDQESRRIYSNVICNRIAPQYAQYNFWEMYSDGEYFESGFYHLTEKENFVDCGAYTGDTVRKFCDVVKGRYNNIYAFELANENYNKLVDNLDGMTNVWAYNMGVWNENTIINYGKEENGSRESFSILKSDNSTVAKVVKLDDILKGKQISLIKMDIEGAELNALMGCEKILKEQKPKLTVCIYHKLDDFWTIPQYIKKTVPEYKISIRHHQYGTMGGTVLYAY